MGLGFGEGFTCRSQLKPQFKIFLSTQALTPSTRSPHSRGRFHSTPICPQPPKPHNSAVAHTKAVPSRSAMLPPSRTTWARTLRRLQGLTSSGFTFFEAVPGGSKRLVSLFPGHQRFTFKGLRVSRFRFQGLRLYSVV